MNDPTLKQCETCNEEFEDRHRAKVRRFCSSACKSRAASRRRRGADVKDGPKASHCLTCSEPLAGRQVNARYCDEICWRRWREREKRGVLTQDTNDPCALCGGPMPRTGARRRRFCSSRCCDLFFTRRATARRRPILLRRCLVCAVDIPPSANLRQKYCGPECRDRRTRSPEVVFQYVHARRAKLAGSTPRPLPKRLLARMRTAACLYCGGPGGTVDHVVPLSRGGQHAEGNLVPACRSCNSSKMDKLLVEWRLTRSRGR